MDMSFLERDILSVFQKLEFFIEGDMIMKKFVSAAVAAVMSLSCALSFTGCGSTASADKLSIGGIGPTTGENAIYGNAVKYGAEIAIEEINALGGLQLELNFQDDAADSEKAVNAYNNLKDWGMQVLMGTVTSTPSTAVAPEANADRIFMITPSGSSTDVIGGIADASGNVTVERRDNVFQVCFTDPNQGIASAQYISEQNLGEKIAVIYNSSDVYSTGIYSTFMNKADELGLNVVNVSSFTNDTANDFNVQLTEAKSAGADLIFLPIYFTPASLILSQADAMGYAPKFFGVDGMDGILTMEGFDTSLAEGVMLLTPFVADAEDARTQSFVAKYKEKHGETPNQFAADAYDTIYAIYEAATVAGVTTDMDAATICEKLIATFTDPSFTVDGLTGDSMTWSTTGEVSKAPKGMVIKDGVYVGM